MKSGEPGRHRNWHPVDFRLEQVPWPKNIDALCSNCYSKLAFEAQQTYEFTGAVFKQFVPNQLKGRGVCSVCVRVVNEIAWPEHAFFQYHLNEGTVWAWNQSFVDVLRARLRPIRPTDEEYLEMHELALHYLARLPKFVVIKKNRALLLKHLENA